MILEKLLGGGERRASPENPSTNLSNPAAWLYDALGANPTATGRSVSPESAMNYTAAHAAIKILTESVACLPAHVYQKNGKARRVATEHPVDRLLHERPNEAQTPYKFFETLMAHLVGWGNAYVYIEWSRGGKPLNLLLLHPKNTTPRRVNGVLEFETYVNGTPVVLSPEEVLHIPGLGYDGLKGYSPLGLARQAIALGMGAEEWSARMYGNAAMPTGVLLSEKQLSATARENLRSGWDNHHRGLDNAHRTAVLEEGIKWEPLSINPEDAQLLDSRKFQKLEICTIYRIPPHMMGEMDRATFNNVESLGIQFVNLTLTPWITRIEQEINYKLLGNKPEYFAKFNPAGLMRGDTASRYAAHAIGRQWGFLSINDIREKEDMDPVEGGDAYLDPLNMKPAGAPTPAPGARSLPEPAARLEHTGGGLGAGVGTRLRLDARESHAAALADNWRRLIRREAGAARAAMKRATGGAGAVAEALESHLREWPGTVAEHLVAPVAGLMRAALAGVALEVGQDAGQDADALARDFCERHGRVWAETSRDTLTAALAQAGGIEAWAATREADAADNPARRLIRLAAEHAARAAYTALGVDTEWRAPGGKECRGMTNTAGETGHPDCECLQISRTP